MKRPILKIGIALGAGLGLAVTLFWLLSGGASVSQAQGADGQRTYYVAPGGDCGGASPCHATVQAAVDAVDDPGDVVKVATGVYSDVNHRAGLAQVVYVSKTVTIRGGYNTTNWLHADPAVHATTLHAGSRGRVLYITGTISVTIEGLSLTGGNATGLGGNPLRWQSGDVGGAVFVVGASVAISNTSVSSSTADWGAGGFLHAGAAALRGNAFTSNTAGWAGGGLWVSESPATIAGNVFVSNTAVYGGGLVESSLKKAQIRDNTICGNRATYGGGAYVEGSNATLGGNRILSNTASDSGGGVFVDLSIATLEGNEIHANRAVDGGGLYVQRGWPTIRQNTVLSNTASALGGGLYLLGYLGAGTDFETVLDGNRFASNTADGAGGGLYLAESDATLTNNVIADNHGGGLYAAAGSIPCLLHTTIARNGDTGVAVVEGSHVALTNTILVSHTAGLMVTAGSTATLASTLWGSGAWANQVDWDGKGLVITGSLASNVRGLPAFVAPNDGDYHIASASAAIDAGRAAGVGTDIDREPRLGVPDLGADEYWAPGALKRSYLPLVFGRAP